MTTPTIRHDTWILVGDGEKALILRNEGDEVHLNLKVERLFEQDNPATHAQGADRPGRMSTPMGPRSAVAETDWHRIEKTRFAKDVADRLHKLAEAGRFDRLVIIAPPHTLGDLRVALHPEVKRRVVAEVDKSLTHHPVPDIERMLAAG